MKKFLVIQTAFIGDAILATGIIEKLHQFYPDAQIDYVVRKGNEALFQDHPYIKRLIVWNKQEGKYKQLIKTIRTIREVNYDAIICAQRYAAAGYMTARGKAKEKIGFDKNPLSFLFSTKIKHNLESGRHEIERNNDLITHLTDGNPAKPKLYPTRSNEKVVEEYQSTPYIVIAPASVWFTKQTPEEIWVEFISTIKGRTEQVYLIGSPADQELCDRIIAASQNPNVINLAGKLSLLDSTALIAKAKMNFVNDSAPMHLASAMNAPTTAIYCSTIPKFGFGPLSDVHNVVEVKEKLDCRPCGIHGFKECPQVHFKCGKNIDIHDLIATLD